MLATYGGKFLQVTTICVLLPYTIRCISQNQTYIPISEKRSLNNYIATSVPYTVENQSSNLEDLSTHEKVDTALTNSDGNSQDVLDCLNENHCVNNNTSNEPSSSEGTFRPYSQDELNKILQKYHGEKDNIEAQETSNKVANYYSIANSNNIESSSLSSTDSHDKSKAWNVVNYSQNYNKNPYDDRMGWVTLEPIAWSSSQVQKWEPNQKPMWPLPPSNNGPWGSSSQYQQQPAYSSYSERPFKKPTYQYQNNRPWSANQHFQKPSYGDSFGSAGGNQEIITDGQPGYFPAERPSSTGAYKPWVEQTQSISYIDSSNRPATHVVYQGIGTAAAHPHHISERPSSASSSSAEGDGHWVLLSSTKGYSVPHRQRSFGRSLDQDDKVNKADAKEEKPDKSFRPLSARRSIQLTVLPSLNGQGKTVTSHNGMIEVENTHQTVDEAHREHLARMMRFNNSQEESLLGSSPPIPGKVEAVSKPATRRNAVLSAVGAGMIPATMAMLLPMLLGRRKRSVHEPHIITLNLKKYNKRGIITEYQNKPVKEISKKRILSQSQVQFY